MEEVWSSSKLLFSEDGMRRVAVWCLDSSTRLVTLLLALSDDLLLLAIVLVTAATIGCSIALWKNKYVSVLRVDAVRKLQEAKPLSTEHKKFKIAMAAETIVEGMLKEEGWRHVYPNRRVAVSRVGHNREIDIIAVGPRILVVEVKHWRGYVWSSGSCWYQRPHLRGQTLEFENVYSDNVEKAAALRRYIENTQRIPLPDNLKAATEEEGAGTWYTSHALHTYCGAVVVPVVVFSNPDVRLDPDTIMKMENVFTLSSFRDYLRELRWEQQRSSSWLRGLMWWNRTPKKIGGKDNSGEEVFMSVKTERRVAAAVDLLRTWDVLNLHDGRIITGDVQNVIAPTAFCSYERKHILDIKLEWNVGWMGVVKTLLTNRSASVEIVLATAKRLAVKKKENKPRNAKGNIVFSIRPRQRRVTACDRLVIRAAGNTTPMQIAFADIKEILLSKHLYITEKRVLEAA